MSHQYKVIVADNIKEELGDRLPEAFEAGPVTIASMMGNMQRQLGDDYIVVEDPDEYAVHVKSAKVKEFASKAEERRHGKA